MRKKPTVVMIGVDMAAKGGVASVIQMYKNAGLFQKVRFIPSYRDGNIAWKLFAYAKCLVQFSVSCMSEPSIRVVHIHTSSYGSFLRKSIIILLSKWFQKETIVHLHGAGFNVFYETMPDWIRKTIRYVLCRSDVLIALSHQWQNDLFRMTSHPDIRILYNPTVMRQPAAQKSTLNKNSESTDNIHFLFMGRIGQRKGVYDILQSMQQLRDNPIKVSLYGDGDTEAVQSKISEADLSDKISICGWAEGAQKEEAFMQADVLLLPSYHEGLPISVLEAMAYGLPVIATDVGGISEAVLDEVNGYLIRPGECDHLADRMACLARSSELRVQMGQSGYALAQSKFSLPVIMKQLEELYAELVERKISHS